MSREFKIVVGDEEVTAAEMTEVLAHLSMQVIEVTEITKASG